MNDHDMWSYQPKPQVKSVTSREQQLMNSIRVWQGICFMLGVTVIICMIAIGR